MNLLESLWVSPLVHRFGCGLLHFVWQGLLIAVVLAVAMRMLRGRSAGARYLSGWAALLAMALVVPITAWLMSPPPVTELPGVELPTDSAEPGAGAVEPYRLDQARSPAMAQTPAIAAPVEPPAMAPTESADDPAAAAGDPLAVRASEWVRPALPWVVCCWLAGTFALSLWRLSGWMFLRRLCRLGTSPASDAAAQMLERLLKRLRIGRGVELLESALIEVPTVIGWLRPVILLPASIVAELPAEQLELILAHELAHIRRHDFLLNLVQTAIETLLFYHPAVWCVSRRIRIEREACCDDLAVAGCGDRLLYARALAKLEELRHEAPSSTRAGLGVAADGAPLLSRIRRVLGLPGDDQQGRGTWLSGSLAVLLIGGLVAYAATAGEPKAKPADHLAAEPVTLPGEESAAGPSSTSSSSVPEWGQPVEGVQVRLRAAKSRWNEGKVVRLWGNVRNQGTRNLLVSTQFNRCELEVDGRWYRRPQNTLETRMPPQPFPPGRQYDNIAVDLDQWWELASSQNAGRPGRPEPVRLKLTAGKHTVRVAFTAPPAKNAPGKPVRAVSNPVVIEVISAKEIAARPERLKSQKNAFELRLAYHEPRDNPNQSGLDPIRSLILHTTLVDYDLLHGWSAISISQQQAARIIDHLQADGSLSDALPFTDDLPPSDLDGPAYSLTVKGPDNLVLYKPVGWGLSVLDFLERLRTVLDGDAAQAVDQLMDVLGPQRKQWEAVAKWGRAVEGVQVRLRAEKSKWTEGVEPQFSADVRNLGTRNLLVYRAGRFWTSSELEIDGRWYRRPLPEHNYRPPLSDLVPGRQFDKILVNLRRGWSAVDSPSQDAGETGVTLSDGQLKLAPGKHTIRVAPTMPLAGNRPGDHVRAISNAVEIEIELAEKLDTGAGREEASPKVRGDQTELLCAVTGTVTDEQGRPLEGVQLRANCGIGSLWPAGRAVTDKQGQYTLRFRPGLRMYDDATGETWRAGLLAISASKPGYTEKNLGRRGALRVASHPNAWGAWGGKPEDVILPNKPGRLDFVMVPSAAVEGELEPAGNAIVPEKPVAKDQGSAWGKPVEGVQSRLRRGVFRNGEQWLSFDLRNDSRELSVQLSPGGVPGEILVDNVPYRWEGRIAGALPVCKPGQRVTGAVFTLDKNWTAIKTVSGPELLELKPGGKHTVQAIVYAAEDAEHGGRQVRVLSNQVEIDVPARQAEPHRESEPLVIDLIRAEGNLRETPSFWIDYEQLDEEALRERVTRLLKASPGLKVVVRSDRAIPHEQVVELLDLLKTVGAKNVSLTVFPLGPIFALTPGPDGHGVIRGKVIGPENRGEPVKYTVTLEHEKWRNRLGRLPNLVVSAGEAFEFRNVPPGNCKLRAQPIVPVSVIPPDRKTRPAGAVAEVEVTLEDKQVVEVEIAAGDDNQVDISVNVADSPKVTVDLINAVGSQQRPSFWIGRERLTREALLDRLGELRDKSPTLRVAIRHTASTEEKELTALRQSLAKLNIQDVSIGRHDLPHVFAYPNAKHNGTIRGRVVDAHPTVPSPKYRVMLWNKSWETMSGVNPELVVGAGEAFEFRNVGPGDYELRTREWQPNGRVVHFGADWTYIQTKAAVEDGKVAEVQVAFGKGDTGRWSDAYTWGEAVEGLIIHVTRAKFTIAPGEKIELHVDIRNGGKIDRNIVLNHEHWELEIDGKWLKESGGASSGRAVYLLEPKQAQHNVDVWVWLGKNMTKAVEGLPPGKHTLRVAHLLNGQGRSSNDPPQIRVVSQPVIIEVVAEDEGEGIGAADSTRDERVAATGAGTAIPPPDESAVELATTRRVIDAQGSPIAGAKVGFYENRTPRGEKPFSSTVTDEDGKFPCPDQAPDKVRFSFYLVVSAPGFRTGQWLGHFLVDGRRIGAPLPDTLRLDREVTVSGVVLGADGKPLAGVSLAVDYFNQRGTWANLRRIESDEQGRFKVDDLPPADIFIRYEKDKDDTLKGAGGAQLFISHVRAKDGQQVENVVVDLSKAKCVVEGQVVDHKGNGIEGASVKANFAASASRLAHYAWARTDRNGRYRIEGLPPHEFLVSAWSKNHFGGPGERVKLEIGETKTLRLLGYLPGHPAPEPKPDDPRWGKPAGDLRAAVELRPGRETYELGEIVEVRPILRNTGEKTVTLIHDFALAVQLQVTDEAGKTQTFSYKGFSGITVSTTYVLEPGHEVEMQGQFRLKLLGADYTEDLIQKPGTLLAFPLKCRPGAKYTLSYDLGEGLRTGESYLVVKD